MAEAQTQKNEETTEDKAAAIGKEMGVEKDETPDFDITEEDDDAQEDDGDKKIAKEREPSPKTEKKERPVLSSKEKRALRKKRLNDKFSEKDAIIRQQQEQLDHLSQWKQTVEGRLSGINKAEVDKALNDNIAAFNAAQAEHTAAFTEGDGAKATRSMQTMYAAQKNIDQLKVMQQNVAQQSQPKQQTQQPDAGIVNKAKAWAERNVWYNPDGKHADSNVAKALSETLVNEGFDPKSDDFWDELDDRIEQYLPNVKNEEDEIDEDEEEEVRPAPKSVRKRTGPPVGSGANRGDVQGKVPVKLSTKFIKELKDAGIWDDTAKRNRVIANHLKILKDNQ